MGVDLGLGFEAWANCTLRENCSLVPRTAKRRTRSREGERSQIGNPFMCYAQVKVSVLCQSFANTGVRLAVRHTVLFGAIRVN
ncbi:hypothetical protein H6F98_25640 [Microcoleus sp. FACHB-SPT15]|uniref:hypothetical protein n=1 Tax=Microcoleus sp. FACHB-SPT15 TaxID=2692830 RepID=UPI0017857026|nr:hypothetical protein [Microcoleus sp. FACHB-SPT15]MBD1808813.1 hypothetical protein [Microcoleus sp. FACHB-SPT15]